MASTARALYAKLSPGGTALGTVRDYYYFLNVCFECVYEREREREREYEISSPFSNVSKRLSPDV
jgi:hypothetical protein